MPNQRAEGQKMLPVMVSEDFIRTLDGGLPQAGYSNRSQFIRDAIIEKLTRAGIAMPKALALSPSRLAPAPDARRRKPESSSTLNDGPSSKPAAKLALSVAAAVSYAKQRARRQKPRP
jgi:hypothetical protein